MVLPRIDIGKKRGEWIAKLKEEERQSFAETIRRLIDAQMSTDEKLEENKVDYQKKMMKQHKENNHANN